MQSFPRKIFQDPSSYQLIMSSTCGNIVCVIVLAGRVQVSALCRTLCTCVSMNPWAPDCLRFLTAICVPTSCGQLLKNLNNIRLRHTVTEVNNTSSHLHFMNYKCPHVDNCSQQAYTVFIHLYISQSPSVFHKVIDVINSIASQYSCYTAGEVCQRCKNSCTLWLPLI